MSISELARTESLSFNSFSGSCVSLNSQFWKVGPLWHHKWYFHCVSQQSCGGSDKLSAKTHKKGSKQKGWICRNVQSCCCTEDFFFPPWSLFFSVSFVQVVNVIFLFMGNTCTTVASRASCSGMKVWRIKITPQSLTNLLRWRRSSFARLVDGWDRWPEQDDKENICLRGQKGCK